MRFDQQLQPATFVRRENRFQVTVESNHKTLGAHLPNSGRLGELLTEGRRVWLRPSPGAHRRTQFDLLLAEHAGTLVSVDARLPNPLVHEALLAGRLPSFRTHDTVQREALRSGSRLDFLLADERGQRCWLETKSVTLVESGRALFPDAPTARGRRHVIELQEAVATGDRAAVVFVIQRADAHHFSPHHAADPDFALALREAHARGVAVMAFRCRVTLSGIALAEPLPVILPP